MRLHQNHPNPFNPTTTIRFDLTHESRVDLSIFDVAGRRVRVLIGGEVLPGRRHAVLWNGIDDAGRRVPSGVYLYRLQTADFTAARRMLLLE